MANDADTGRLASMTSVAAVRLSACCGMQHEDRFPRAWQVPTDFQDCSDGARRDNVNGNLAAGIPAERIDAGKKDSGLGLGMLLVSLFQELWHERILQDHIDGIPHPDPAVVRLGPLPITAGRKMVFCQSM